MKKYGQVIVGAGLCLLLLISWVVVATGTSETQKQLELIEEAWELIENGVYIRAVPLLEKAASINGAHTAIAEDELKKVYLNLIDTRGFARRYTNLLEKQMSRRDVMPDVFMEAANYYLNASRLQNALAVLRDGIGRTGALELIELYESSRYEWRLNRTAFDNVTLIYKDTIQVERDGKWGIANSDGTIIIPCEHDKISNFNIDRAIVRNGNEIYAIDINSNRLALAPTGVMDFGNYAESRIPLLINNNWQRATGYFEVGAQMFEEIGMYSNNFAAASTNGLWGVIDRSDNWLLPAKYDDIIRDEMGRSYAQNAVFARLGDFVYLYVNGTRVGGAFEDARPFENEGFAAVKNNGKWGFIDNEGVLKIDYSFDDALSFGQHLAAVKVDNFWGYINAYGQLVIDATFLDAKSFSNGNAPVLTDRGWQFITLIEFTRRVS